MKHIKQGYMNKVISAGIPTLLMGEAGSGKSTILMNAAKDAGVPYSFQSCTRQTSVGDIVGFISVNGLYIPTPFRKAYEEGHYFNLDELDALDPNTALVFNSLENGRIAWPDGYDAPPHKNFRLVATANPESQGNIYTGRSKLDKATLDRFYTVNVDRDATLEVSLTSVDTVEIADAIRGIFNANAISQTITMRDVMRAYALDKLQLEGCDPLDVYMLGQPQLYTEVQEAVDKIIKRRKPLSDAKNIDELFDILKD